jgi:hypothetical protein
VTTRHDQRLLCIELLRLFFFFLLFALLCFLFFNFKRLTSLGRVNFDVLTSFEKLVNLLELL